MRPTSIQISTALVAILILGVASASPSTSQRQAATPAPFRTFGMELVPALQRATDVGPANPDQLLTLAISMPFAKPEEAQAFADAVSDPKSPQYGHFITPEEVGARFGIPQAQVEQVAAYMAQHGFSIELVAPNRLAVLANGTVAQAEQAFHTTIREYTLVPRNKAEPERFLAYSTPVQLPAELAAIVVDVCGLETYTRPMPLTGLLTPALTRGLYNTIGIYNANNKGQGRTVGMSNFDGFRSADWLNYIAHFALPVPVGGAGTNIITVPVSGGGAGAGAAGGEGDLDIQMQLGMAPLATFRIYDSPAASNLIAVLALETSQNLCEVISESYGWNLSSGTASSAHSQHVSMSAQGITYMAASGDNGTSIEPFSYPGREPEVLSVGGTVANVNASTGVRISEVGWSGSGGGWSNVADAFNVRPTWQVGTGVPPINGTNNHRLIPDLAFHAAGSSTGAYQFYSGGVLQSNSIGTSFAAPMFAGSLAVIEQYVVSQGGLSRFGRIQNVIYAQNGRPDVWHDITSGNNGNLPSGGASNCTVAWDTVTGWGPMDCGSFAAVEACATGPGCGLGISYCFGDAIDPLVSTLCPCFNFGAAGHGCANSGNANGAVISASGSIVPDTVVLNSTGELPTSLSIFLQGNNSTSAGIVFGAGIRCVSGQLLRLYSHNAVGGSVNGPTGLDSSITIRSSLLGDTIPAGSTRYYAVYYRDPSAVFCPVATFNVSNSYAITW